MSEVRYAISELSSPVAKIASQPSRYRTKHTPEDGGAEKSSRASEATARRSVRANLEILAFVLSMK